MVLWKLTKGPKNLEEIRIIERELKVNFPDEFVSCVLAFDGGRPVPNQFNTNKRNGYFMHRLLSFREEPDDGSYGILNTIYYSKEALPHGVIPFGYEETGDLICFDFKDNPHNPSIVLWKHEIAPEEIDVGSQEEMRRIGLEYIGDSFAKFIESLY